MKPVAALFINGVFESVLEEIYEVQEVLPEQIMFLQPYSGSAISRLREDPPSVDSPVQLLISITNDLTNIHYHAEIVGWENKPDLSGKKREFINQLIATLQPEEQKLYHAAKGGTGESVNLLYIRRLRKVSPYSVAKLQKLSDGEPLSTARTTAGGWSYINPKAIPDSL